MPQLNRALIYEYLDKIQLFEMVRQLLILNHLETESRIYTAQDKNTFLIMAHFFFNDEKSSIRYSNIFKKSC